MSAKKANSDQERESEEATGQEKPRRQDQQLREYVRVPGYVMRLPQLTGKAPLILAKILDYYSQDHRKAWPGLQTLGRECGCSTWSARMIVNRLEADGLLKIERGNTVDSNCYRSGETLKRLAAKWEEIQADQKTKRRDKERKYSKAATEIFKDARSNGVCRKPTKPLGRKPTNPVCRKTTKGVCRKPTTKVYPSNEHHSNGEKVERMTAANPADAGSTAANLSFQTGRRGNSFAPEILLDKLRSVLGADFGDALSKKELRTRLTALDDAVEAAARKLTKINAGVLPELPFVVEKHNVLMIC